jgi:hypothetical protein
MFAANLLRAITFAGGAAFLIFSQNHSLTLGVNILLYLTTATSIGGLALLLIPNIKTSITNLLAPSAIALLIFCYGISTWFGGVDATDKTLSTLRVLFGLFVVALAVTELAQSFLEKNEDTLELRISAGIGILAALVFFLVPMDILNTLGILSAYLALSAVQRGVWMATGFRKES